MGADLGAGDFEEAESPTSGPGSSHTPGVPKQPCPQTQASSQPLEGRADTEMGRWGEGSWSLTGTCLQVPWKVGPVATMTREEVCRRCSFLSLHKVPHLFH